MPLAAGGRLGRYDIIGALGAGGMGEVYEAFDPLLKRRIALKTLAAGLAADPERIARFTREAESVAALNHPNVVTLHSIEEAEGIPFLTMELVDGQPLSKTITPGGLPIERALALAVEICDAVRAAHERGIVHRDLKPANVMVTSSGHVKVLDFGLSKYIAGDDASPTAITRSSESLTGAGPAFLGTVAYVSPEQAEGKRVDQRSDVFSFGIVFYEMLTGERPFTGRTDLAILSAILKETPRPMRELRTAVPAELDQIVQRCLAKFPADRYQSFEDVRRDLTAQKLNPVQSPAAPWGIAVLLVAALAVLIYVSRGLMSRDTKTGETPRTPQAFTELTTSGTTRHGAISADGRYVAYIERDAETYALLVRDVKAGSTVTLYTGRVGEVLLAPTVSPDGSYVDFVVRVIGTGNSLWRVPLLGGPPRKLVDALDSGVSWSPDGAQMAFFRQVSGGTALILANRDGGAERPLVHRKTEVFRTFGSVTGRAQAVRPVWSPNGNYLASPLTLDTSTLTFAAVPSGRERPLKLRLANFSGALAWLDDHSVAVIGIESLMQLPFRQQIWRLAIDSGELSRLSNDVNDYEGLSITADRSRLVTTRVERRVGVWVMDRQGGNVRVLLPSVRDFGEETLPLTWVSDDRVITTYVGGTLISVSPGKAAQPLVPNAMNPGVSRDGSTLVFSRLSDDQLRQELWKADADGRRQVRLAPMAAEHAITPGDEAIYAGNPDNTGWRLWRVSLRGGNPRELLNGKQVIRGGAPSVSPDGERLMFRTQTPDGKLALGVCQLPDCTGLRTFPDPGRLPQWAPDSRRVAYVPYPPGPQGDIWIRPLEGGPAERVTNFDEWTVTGFGWSKSGKHLAVARSSRTSDVVSLSLPKPE